MNARFLDPRRKRTRNGPNLYREPNYSPIHLQSTNPEESVYPDWDCPQATTVHRYSSAQDDELHLEVGDIVNVLRKIPDGTISLSNRPSLICPRIDLSA